MTNMLFLARKLFMTPEEFDEWLEKDGYLLEQERFALFTMYNVPTGVCYGKKL